MEFSKKLVISAWLAVVISWVAVLVGTLVGLDVEGLTELAVKVLEAATVISGFYAWKAKNENRLKITKSMVNEWAEKYGIDAVVPLAEIVLKE